MVNTQNLLDIIDNFESSSKPTSATGSAPATVDDINKVIRHTANVLRAFVEELEQED